MCGCSSVWTCVQAQERGCLCARARVFVCVRACTCMRAIFTYERHGTVVRLTCDWSPRSPLRCGLRFDLVAYVVSYAGPLHLICAWSSERSNERNKKKIELFVRDFFKIQLVVNPLRKKITFSFDEVQCFYFLKEFRTNIVRFFFISFIWTFRTSGTYTWSKVASSPYDERWL